MNTQLAGVTGQAIIKAVLAGERNPWRPAQFRDNRVSGRSRAAWRGAVY